MPDRLTVGQMVLDHFILVRIEVGQQMIIRNYKSDDYFIVASILKEANLFDEIWDSEQNLDSMISKDSESILVAEIDGAIVANLFIVPYGNKVSYLFRLVVKKDFRKQGIASGLIEKANKIAKQRKVSEVGLYVDSNDKELQGFYKRRGFNISEKSYNYMWSELR